MTGPIDPRVQEGEAVSVNIYHHLLSHVSRTELELPVISTFLLGHPLTARLSTCCCVSPAPGFLFQRRGSPVLCKPPQPLNFGKRPRVSEEVLLLQFCPTARLWGTPLADVCQCGTHRETGLSLQGQEVRLTLQKSRSPRHDKKC